jgi:hypothetical protein
VPELTKRLNQSIQLQAGNLAYDKLLNVRRPPPSMPETRHSSQDRGSSPLQKNSTKKGQSPTKL